MKIKSQIELEQRLSSLPPIKKGYVRVYRGQNEKSNSIVCSKKDNDLSLLSSLSDCGKALIVILNIIGDCSEGFKLKAFPSKIENDKGEILASNKSAGIVTGPRIYETEKNYHGIYNVETLAPYEYLGQHLSDYKVMTIDSVKSFYQLEKEQTGVIIEAMLLQ